MPAARRFPSPWSAEVTPNCFIVRDANGQQLAYVYYECEPGRRPNARRCGAAFQRLAVTGVGPTKQSRRGAYEISARGRHIRRQSR